MRKVKKGWRSYRGNIKEKEAGVGGEEENWLRVEGRGMVVVEKY